MNRQKRFRELFHFRKDILGKCVSAYIVNNYADTYKNTRTLSEIFEGYSQILKEQSGE